MKNLKHIGCICLLSMSLFAGSMQVNAEKYEYDKYDRVTRVEYDDGSYVTYEYDANGNITKTTVYDVKAEAARRNLDTPKLVSADVAATGVTVKWEAVDKAEKYRVFRKEGTGEWKKLADVTPDKLTYTDKKAVSGKTYSYTVCCVTEDGVDLASKRDETGLQVTFYAPPTLTSVTNVTGGVTLKWGAVTGITKYRVLRKEGSGDWMKIGVTDATEYKDTTAVSGKTYTYSVRCVTADGKTYLSSFDKTGLTVTYVAGPAMSSIKSVTDGIYFDWKAISNVSKYRILRKEGTGEWQQLAEVAGTKLNYTDKTAASGVAYSYTVCGVMKDTAGTVSGYDETGLQGIFYAPPVLSSVKNIAGGVNIKWKAVKGVSTYRVLRKEGTGDWVKVGDSTANSFNDLTAVSGKTYSYSVRCLAEDGKTYISSFDKTGLTITYVAAPVISSAKSVQDGIRIQWGAVDGVKKYRVYRKTGTDIFRRIAEVSTAAYTDTTAESGINYTYTVRCISEDGLNDLSSYDTTGVSVTYIATPVINSLKNVATGIQVKWDAIPGAEKYRVYRKTKGTGWTMLADVTSGSYVDTTAQECVTYYYTVRCVDKDGNNASSCDTVGQSVTRLGAPELISVNITTKGYVKITWKAMEGATGYTVFRKTEGGSWQTRKNITDGNVTSYADPTVVAGQTYYYTVRSLKEDIIGGYNTKGLKIVP